MLNLLLLLKIDREASKSQLTLANGKQHGEKEASLSGFECFVVATEYEHKLAIYESRVDSSNLALPDAQERLLLVKYEPNSRRQLSLSLSLEQN